MAADLHLVFNYQNNYNLVYEEECSSASTNLETAGQFSPHKKVKAAIYRSWAKRLPLMPSTFQELEISAHWRMKMYESWLNILSGTFKNIEGTFKIVPEWYQQMFTIHVKDLPTYHEIFDNLMLKAAASGVVRRPHTVICDFETALIPAVQASFPAFKCRVPLRSRNKEEDSNGDGNSIFAASEVPAAVDLLGRNARTNNYLEDWHLKMNQQMKKHHLSFYELLHLLIDEQGSSETLIQMKCTAEYDGGARTMEQFLKAIAYDVPEPVNSNGKKVSVQNSLLISIDLKK
ncbi:hypothetical protein T4E_5613 [Trichinella pseudospiralis]|uniref:MULE transposase domain-containing protein n=1 Tax=Trichinella pseudospiralis TaxID=6337 RepID=A0A0V0XYV9_TRIPS|nr:hypothetical protein T4E_5613 [Trichinella pseudospiralis]KRY91814.1 hypothetical protein T4D_12543 [Trichinella pseudospiralis]